MLQEKPFKLANGHTRLSRDVQNGRDVVAALHCGNGDVESGDTRAGMSKAGCPLRLARSLDGGQQQTIRNAGGDRPSKLTRDEVQEKFRSRDASRCRRRGTESEGRWHSHEFAVALGQRLLILPMHGTLAGRDYPRLHQGQPAGAKPDHLCPMGMSAAQESKQLLWKTLSQIVLRAANDYEEVAPPRGLGSAMDGGRQPRRIDYLPAVHRPQLPVVSRARGKVIGQPQRLDPAGKGHHHEAVEQKEVEAPAAFSPHQRDRLQQVLRARGGKGQVHLLSPAPACLRGR